MRSKYSKVSDPNSFVSDPGTRERIIYSAKINENHVIEVVPAGKEDWQDYISIMDTEGNDLALVKCKDLSKDRQNRNDG